MTELATESLRNNSLRVYVSLQLFTCEVDVFLVDKKKSYNFITL